MLVPLVLLLFLWCSMALFNCVWTWLFVGVFRIRWLLCAGEDKYLLRADAGYILDVDVTQFLQSERSILTWSFLAGTTNCLLMGCSCLHAFACKYTRWPQIFSWFTQWVPINDRYSSSSVMLHLTLYKVVVLLTETAYFIVVYALSLPSSPCILKVVIYVPVPCWCHRLIQSPQEIFIR